MSILSAARINDLSFDPRDPLYPVPAADGVRWGLTVYTT